MRSALLLALVLALAATGCSREAETVVEVWEELGAVIEDHAGDCPALASALKDFESEHADLFAADMVPIYEEIEADPDLRFRMERALAVLESQEFACRDDAAVQAAAASLFGELLEAAGGAGESPAPAGSGPRKP